MPLQPTTTEIRLNNILKCFTIAVDTLEVLANSFKTPFLEPISSTANSLLTAVQTVKQNKSDCAQLLEQTYGLLYAIISLHATPDTAPDLSPSMLNHLGKFTDTLYKIHTFVEAQQDKSKIRHFFRQGEMSKLLRDCNMGLQEALDHFKLQDINLLNEVGIMQKFAEDRHQEVLGLIDALSSGTTSDKGSLTTRVLSSSYNSSTSISMLPSEPKIFHGRQSEVSDILKLFMRETPRIAILGAGGMGKTSLARAVLHHPTITGKYAQHRFFVACDSTSSKDELVILIGAHLGLKPKKDLAKMVLHHFATNPACLLVLDNLETLWELTGIRRDIEEFLSLLTDVAHLALIITMRGTERPASVHWTRPFLPALKPLTHDAARQTFIDIADDCHDSDDINKVLLLTDNMPLAIDLMAHLVESEGCPSVLARWEEEKTSVISNGYDKRSNLDLSISISLSSPRITSVAHCQELLSLLSMLPDGLSDIELVQSKLPIKDILTCKAALLSTSLAYSDDHRRFKTLVPIRGYMTRSYPPMDHLVQALLNYFYQLLEVDYKYSGTVSVSEITLRITSNFSNIQGLLLNRLQHQNPAAVDTIYCILYFNAFSRFAGQGRTHLMDHIAHTHLPCGLEVFYITEILGSWQFHPIPHPEVLVEQAMKQLSHFDESDVKCKSSSNLLFL
ncbi:P-loop containing nucleoside triphosphate hydrolase protein [Mycena vulgaris]|nr:P-loop containing nucleoside triphosphate hydrolase protein [Mycena vulgaris]